MLSMSAFRSPHCFASAPSYGASNKVMIAGFAVITAVMLWNTGLSAYHAGVEWKFWPGPNDCSGPINSFGSAGNLLKQLQDIRIVRCDEAAWRFLGISLAGYDVLVSLFLAAVAGWGLKASLARREPGQLEYAAEAGPPWKF